LIRFGHFRTNSYGPKVLILERGRCNILSSYLVIINYHKLVVWFRARVVSFQMSIIQGVDNIL